MDENNTPNTYRLNDTAAGHSAPLTDEERRHLEMKLQRVLAWVGVWIPELVELDGSKIPLHQVIWGLVKKEKLSKDDESLLLSLEEKLDKRFQEDVNKIDKTDTTEEEALNDYSEAAGLLRATVALKGVQSHEEQMYGKTELQQRIRNAKKEKARRWMEFLRQMEIVNP